MAAVDPYSPCPCGSQEKYKWCCHKAEEPALRAERLIRSEQFDQALKVIDEGLRKVKGALWLLMQKAIVHERRDEPEPARAAVNAILQAKPDHLGALAHRVQSTLMAEGPEPAAADLQSALSAMAPEDRPKFAGVFRMVGVMLVRSGSIPAGIAHLEIGTAADAEDDPIAQPALRSLMTDPGVSAWLKNPYDLMTTPPGLDPETHRRFEAALQAADEALWGQAAAGFETLSADGVAEADRNLGLCRLWMADNAGAIAAFRRYTKFTGPTAEAVDLEALCQQTEPIGDEDLVEHVRLTWPLNNRDGLLQALKDAEQNDKTVVSEGAGVLDPDDPEAEEVEAFTLLDRPRPEARPGMTPSEMARVVGRAIVGQESVMLDGFDLGKQFDDLREQFIALAGANIPPAQPRTDVLEKVARVSLAMRTEWAVPEGLDPEETRRIQREEQARVLREVWPETPLPGLGGRTPRQAIKDGNAQIPLRAAFCQLDAGRANPNLDLPALRAELGIPGEPTPDPASVDIERIHLARLFRVPTAQLSDDRLWHLFLRSRTFGQHRALEQAAQALVNRPKLLDSKGPSERFAVFGDLANLTAGRGDFAEALAWIEQARRDEPPAHRGPNAPRWDFLALRIRARNESPEQWVPELAVVLDRYREDRAASQVVVSNLLDMGLMQMVPHPDQPEQVMLDSRPLMSLISRYGPRVTTASGALGVSASRPEIWTPGGPSSSGGGGVWTPDSPGSSGQGGGERKIILPGQ
ncbi:hypothetical protein AB1L88_09530 [Tautonia sp. JC769]|uniref:hypothetical protein n=1 Tax=Tautonia sp. JC769 TaxID=3232135 RepID=UPI003459E24B